MFDNIYNTVELQSSTSVLMAPQTSTAQLSSTVTAQFVPMQTTSQPQPSTIPFQPKETVIVMTTADNIGSLSPTPNPTSTVEGSQSGSGLSVGATAGIVIFVLILFIVVSTAVIIGLFIIIHKCCKQSAKINKAGSTFSLGKVKRSRLIMHTHTSHTHTHTYIHTYIHMSIYIYTTHTHTQSQTMPCTKFPSPFEQTRLY